NFKTKSIEVEGGVNLLSELENLPKMEIFGKFSAGYNCINHDEKRIYYLDNSFKISNNIDPIGLSSKCMNYYVKYVQNYLRTVFCKMRLFVEGNIYLPCHYFYQIDNSGIERLSSIHTSPYKAVSEKFHLDKEKIPHLQDFLKKTKIPFGRGFLQSALENFELSYEISNNRNLEFLSIMIGLETLFQPNNRGELKYRIARNVAVLLGNNTNKNSAIIFSEVKHLYDKRSKIVHTGKKNIVTIEDVKLLRHYLRESIKEIYNINKEKKEIMKILNSRGFR
ncbi:MAG: hypothetical protein K8R68_11120, partial [Bacteroidales bacterium]|nr:hypothetical protein [Bacteroidales bacterium]